MIENEAFGEKPRKVRCGKCAHVWKQEAPSQEDIGLSRQVRKEQTANLQKLASDKKDGVKPNLPTVIKSPLAKKILKVACWLLFVLNVGAFILLNKQLIGQTAFYDMIGDYDTAGIRIEDVKFDEPYEKEGETTYYFDWAVRNDRQTPMRIPHAKLALLNAEKEIIFETGQAASKEILAKEGKFTFRANKLVDETQEGRYVVIDIGNPHEINARD